MPHSPPLSSGGIKAVSGNLILSCMFAMVRGTVYFISVFTVLEPELWMNLVRSTFMMWPIFIKMPPPPPVIKRQWETGGTTSYTRPDSTWPGVTTMFTHPHTYHTGRGSDNKTCRKRIKTTARQYIMVMLNCIYLTQRIAFNQMLDR